MGEKKKKSYTLFQKKWTSVTKSKIDWSILIGPRYLIRMEIRKRTIYPHGLNKGIDSKFQGYQIQQTPEEGWKVQQSKC